MRLVADTNIVVSGLLWQGAPRQVLDAARARLVTLFTSSALLAELEDVLKRPKLAQRLAAANVAVPELLSDYATLATLIEPPLIIPTIISDPDDDAVLACAIPASAQAIVSGDSHLLKLRTYQGIVILTAAELLTQLAQ